MSLAVRGGFERVTSLADHTPRTAGYSFSDPRLGWSFEPDRTGGSERGYETDRPHPVRPGTVFGSEVGLEIWRSAVRGASERVTSLADHTPYGRVLVFGYEVGLDIWRSAVRGASERVDEPGRPHPVHPGLVFGYEVGLDIWRSAVRGASDERGYEPGRHTPRTVGLSFSDTRLGWIFEPGRTGASERGYEPGRPDTPVRPGSRFRIRVWVEF